VLVNGTGFGSNYSFEAASRSALSNPAKAAAIRDYLTLLNQAYVWASTHTAVWAKLWGDATGLPASVMDKAAVDDATAPATINSSVVSAEQQLVTNFYKAGLIPANVNMSNYIVSTYNGTVTGGSS
jgi:sulfonate transport system substrate-binding protein